MSNAAAFTTIADKLVKLIPRLASNHSGEVTATVAGLDWHDLAQRAATPSLMDVIGVPQPAAPVKPEPAPSRSPPPPPPPKPQREPSPWPTWSTLSRFSRLAMAEEMKEHTAFTPAEEVEFAALYKGLYSGQGMPTRREINLFNRASRNLWECGWRPERRAA